jgi:hypothetical protein
MYEIKWGHIAEDPNHGVMMTLKWFRKTATAEFGIVNYETPDPKSH